MRLVFFFVCCCYCCFQLFLVWSAFEIFPVVHCFTAVLWHLNATKTLCFVFCSCSASWCKTLHVLVICLIICSSRGSCSSCMRSANFANICGFWLAADVASHAESCQCTIAIHDFDFGTANIEKWWSLTTDGDLMCAVALDTHSLLTKR